MLPERELLVEIVERFAPAAALLYGSASAGRLTAASDVDVVCFVEGEERYSELASWHGLVLDVWIHPISDAEQTSNFLKVHDGRVLIDRDGIGNDLLMRVRAHLATKPRALDSKHARHLRAWLWKMFGRATRGGIDVITADTGCFMTFRRRGAS